MINYCYHCEFKSNESNDNEIQKYEIQNEITIDNGLNRQPIIECLKLASISIFGVNTISYVINHKMRYVMTLIDFVTSMHLLEPINELQSTIISIKNLQSILSTTTLVWHKYYYSSYLKTWVYNKVIHWN